MASPVSTEAPGSSTHVPHLAAQWRAVRTGYLLPARVGMPVFRGKCLAALHTALDAGQLTLPAGRTVAQLRMLLHRLGRSKWHVQIMTRYAHGHGVAT